MAARVYLDWNATAPLRPEVRGAMIAAMDLLGNPSSVHAEGRAAKGVVERARAQVAAAVGCKTGEVVFTSGVTEAASVLAQVHGHGAVFVDDTAHDALWSHLDMTDAKTGDNVLAWGLANSETGVVTEPPAPEPSPELHGRQWRYGAHLAGMLLLDVTQAVGRIPWAFSRAAADFAVLSAHKLGGPKGVGALIVREGLDITALQEGGGQEMGRRSGTENVIGIAGFGAAAEAAMRELEAGTWDEVKKLRNILETTLASSANDTIFVGKEMSRLPNTSCLITPGWKGETQVMAMDLAGYAVSSGSACSSGKVRESRVLRAMGYDAEAARSAIRVSMGPATTEEEVRRFADCWLEHHEKFRRKSA